MSLKPIFAVFLFTSLVAAAGCGGGDTSGTGGTGGTTATGGSGGETSTGGAGGATGGAGGSTGGTGGSTGGTGGTTECAMPTGGGVLAIFDVVGQPYRVHITNQTGIDGAIALWNGTSTANIPNGTLVCEPAAYNCDWSFHVDPATVAFAEVTIEVCDGTPSYVDENCASFGNQYCPWSAELVDLRDCRTDSACPVMPK